MFTGNPGLLIILFISVALLTVGVFTVVKIRRANKLLVTNKPRLIVVPGHEDWEITTDLTVLHIRDGFVFFTDGSYVDLTTGHIRNLGTSTIDLFNKRTGEAINLKPIAH
ncbi:MAG: hypothetical protein UZ21_OP11001001138 [Microgenomates bacterium OLB22]|nr:MAG: hypothetical protein UZ21_OP11001001138 [Microgenomates bacterium OLB22]